MTWVQMDATGGGDGGALAELGFERGARWAFFGAYGAALDIRPRTPARQPADPVRPADPSDPPSDPLDSEISLPPSRVTWDVSRHDGLQGAHDNREILMHSSLRASAHSKDARAQPRQHLTGTYIGSI